jgi:hypothetical protein
MDEVTDDRLRDRIKTKNENSKSAKCAIHRTCDWFPNLGLIQYLSFCGLSATLPSTKQLLTMMRCIILLISNLHPIMSVRYSSLAPTAPL